MLFHAAAEPARHSMRGRSPFDRALVTITGWRAGGVDRAALERVAASLR